MNNITLVVGSMRKGNSAYISEIINNNFDNVNVFTLGDGINYCTGCLECDEIHRCHYRNKMDVILPTLCESDILIIVTPVRYSLMSGDVKVFIDRLNPTAVSEKLVGKKIIAIAIGQTKEEEGTIQDALKSLEMFAANAAMEYVGGFPVYSCYGNDELEKKTDVVENIIRWLRDKIKDIYGK